MGKSHFDNFSLTNCDTKTLILLSTKISKLQYLSFYSSDFKSKDRSRKHSINKIHGEKTILYFKFYTSENQGDSLSSLMARLKTVTSERFSKHGFSFFHRNHPFSIQLRSSCNFECLI